VTPRRESREPEPKPKQFSSLEEIQDAKVKLSRRVAQVKELLTKRVDNKSQEVQNAQNSIRGTILEIFGSDSPEYRDNRYFQFFQNANRVFKPAGRVVT
jgi:hypothetical protein